MADAKKGSRIVGADRVALGSAVRRQYELGSSIRELAQSNGRSYGFIHRLLSENDVSLRGRGGATHRRKKPS